MKLLNSKLPDHPTMNRSGMSTWIRADQINNRQSLERFSLSHCPEAVTDEYA